MTRFRALTATMVKHGRTGSRNITTPWQTRILPRLHLPLYSRRPRHRTQRTTQRRHRRTTARRHFNSTDCVGKISKWEQEHLQDHRRHPRHAHAVAFPFFPSSRPSPISATETTTNGLSQQLCDLSAVKEGHGPGNRPEARRRLINNYLNKDDDMLHTSLGDLAKAAATSFTAFP